MARLLALDYGKKRIGLAVTDELQIVSSPLDVYDNNKDFFDKLKKLNDAYHFEKIVVGYPFSETYQEASESVEEFVKQLRDSLKLEVVLQNEEFTSVYAESLLKSMGVKAKKIKSNIDKYAAQKILEDYLAGKK
jgi:putative holliday junction resolvase